MNKTAILRRFDVVVGWCERWSSIFTLLTFVAAVLSILDRSIALTALICAVLTNKFREDEKKANAPLERSARSDDTLRGVVGKE